MIGMRADAIEDIDAAIQEDESFALPKLVKAWSLHCGRDANAAGAINGLLKDAEECLPSTSGRETGLYSALKLARDGKGIESVEALEKIAAESPLDLYVHFVALEEVFWTGRAEWMRDIVERAAPAWHESAEDYGPFLSLRAFANEEAGRLDDAERFGRQAVEIHSADIWGAHAVAHVLLMKGEMQQGADWLETLSPHWRYGNQMQHHLWWHICLFLLELGERDRVVDLLTAEIRNPDSSLVRVAPAAPIDISNVASLLLRLELLGVDVADQWEVLGSICAGRVHNHDNAFANVHDMMVLAATGRFDSAQELLDSMRSRYQDGLGSVALSYNDAGIPACEAVLAHRHRNYGEVLSRLMPVRHDLPLMGASHAQRDVFYQLLVHAADQEGQGRLRAELLREVEQIGFREVAGRVAYQQLQH